MVKRGGRGDTAAFAGYLIAKTQDSLIQISYCVLLSTWVQTKGGRGAAASWTPTHITRRSPTRGWESDYFSMRKRCRGARPNMIFEG